MAVGCELWKHRCSSGILESSLQRTTTVPPLPHAASSRRFLTPLPHAASSRRFRWTSPASRTIASRFKSVTMERSSSASNRRVKNATDSRTPCFHSAAATRNTPTGSAACNSSRKLRRQVVAVPHAAGLDARLCTSGRRPPSKNRQVVAAPHAAGLDARLRTSGRRPPSKNRQDAGVLRAISRWPANSRSTR